jgi:oligopeptide transport system substrate-binding protein
VLRRHAFLLTLSLALVLSLGACRGSAGSVLGPTITLNLGSEPATLDPALATDPPTIQIDRLLFLTLTDLNESDGAAQPRLATKWAVSSDGLIWEFTLRTDAPWVRYSPVTQRVEQRRAVNALDVVYSAQRVFDPRTQSGYARVFAPLIRGAEDLVNTDPARVTPEQLTQARENLGVTAISLQKVRFELTRPVSAFPIIVGAWLSRTAPREAIEEYADTWEEPGNIWSNGPYVLESWAHGRSITLRKNPLYFNAGNVQIERIKFVMIPDASSILDAFAEGTLDATDPYDSIVGDPLQRAQEDPVLNRALRTLPGMCTQYLAFNITKAPFDDANVRKAFAAAVDRDTLITRVLKSGEPARWFARPGILGAPDARDTLGIAFDPARVKQYLTAAGTANKKWPAITLGVNATDQWQQVAATVVQMWKDQMGVDVKISAHEWKPYLTLLQNDPPPIYRLGWCASYPDAASFDYDVFRSGSPENHTGWSNPEYDRLVEQAAQETDAGKRQALYRSAEKILVEDDAVIIPLWWTTRAVLTQPHLERTFAVFEGYEHIEAWRESGGQ